MTNQFNDFLFGMIFAYGTIFVEVWFTKPHKKRQFHKVKIDSSGTTDTLIASKIKENKIPTIKGL